MDGGEQHLLGEFEAEDRKHFGSINATEYYHELQIQDFLQAIMEDRDPMLTGREARIVVEMFTAIYRSNELRRPVEFPVNDD